MLAGMPSAGNIEYRKEPSYRASYLRSKDTPSRYQISEVSLSLASMTHLGQYLPFVFVSSNF